MKTIRTLFLALVALFSVQMAQAQCNAAFTQSGTDPTYTFTITTTPATSNLLYWDFGDGSYSVALSPTHTFALNGTYTVSLTVSDSMLGCQNTSSMQVVVANAASATCNAQFTYGDSSGIYFFNASNPFAGAVYAWTFGDGTSSTQSNPAHVYNMPGTYQVCLTISDPSGGCSDTWCDSVVVGNGGSCDASFTWSNNYLSASFVASSPISGATYSWDFGDGNTSTIANPTHVYMAAGNYNVCLTINDPATSCSDTQCGMVIVAAAPTSGSIFGSVMAGNNPADAGEVYLIVNDPVLGTLTAIDTTLLDSAGGYAFINVPFGTYLVKAALLPSSVNYSSYMPTYYKSSTGGNVGLGELLWSNASDIVLSASANNIFAGIGLVPGTNPGGPGFVGGLVSQGANKADGVGDPLEDINILLLDANGDAVAYAISDNAGAFTIPNLALGTYTIYPEVLGKVTNPMDVTLTATDMGTNKIVVEVNSGTVDVSITTGINPAPQFANVSVYPNPVNDVLFVEFGNTLSGRVSIEIIDVTGRVISISNVDGGTNAQINTEKLNSGVYLLRISDNEGETTFKFIK